MNEIEGVTKTETKIDEAPKKEPIFDLYRSLNKSISDSLKKDAPKEFKKKKKDDWLEMYGMEKK